MKLLAVRVVIALAAMTTLSACVSTGQVDDAFRRIERVWELEYQRSGEETRTRIVDAPIGAVARATRKSFLSLGMPIKNMDAEAQTITAEGEAPLPLSLAEWKEVADRESPRMKEMGGWFLMMQDNPRGYTVTIRATLEPVRGKTVVVLDYLIDSAEIRRMGLVPPRSAPPMAVQIAAAKFWVALQRSLEAEQLPAPRQRQRHELSI